MITSEQLDALAEALGRGGEMTALSPEARFERIREWAREAAEGERKTAGLVDDLEAEQIECGEATIRMEEQGKRAHELEEAIFWACGVVGEFPRRVTATGVRPSKGEGQYWWRKELCMRAGISDEALNARAAEAGG